MRGAPSHHQLGELLRGIIPAYAGSTNRKGTMLKARWDHPRVCGEHALGDFVSETEEGSSPRMRGAPAHFFSDKSNQGIIPAYAGSTEHELTRLRAIRDHPRVCGEHLITHGKGKNLPGSSPRMRGALVKRHINIDRLGIIPAYAGSTKARCW